jgi:hypothetical protein
MPFTRSAAAPSVKSGVQALQADIEQERGKAHKENLGIYMQH